MASKTWTTCLVYKGHVIRRTFRNLEKQFRFWLQLQIPTTILMIKSPVLGGCFGIRNLDLLSRFWTLFETGQKVQILDGHDLLRDFK